MFQGPLATDPKCCRFFGPGYVDRVFPRFKSRNHEFACVVGKGPDRVDSLAGNGQGLVANGQQIPIEEGAAKTVDKLVSDG